MDLGLKGRTALVTGASRGLGRVTALHLAREGCRVIALARESSHLQSISKDLAVEGDAHAVVSCDVMIPGEVDRVVTSLIKDVCPIDIVVHNLGGSLGVTDPLAAQSEYARVWKLNLGVAVEINAILIPLMIARGFGRAVHVSSAAAHSYAGYAPYVSAKSALGAYVVALGRAVADRGVVVSAVEPGPLALPGRFLTNLQDRGGTEWVEYCRNHLPIGRLGKPEEVAAFIVMLSSNLASYAAGSIINIDGGSH